ncbi:response regulator transcription factor [Paremcibacter congregatus]|uniref:response regulator transcription factor n=1 Tax=Paremcibacter congregatus TaxID=2043170 RepID=UPI003A932970
MRLLVVEDQEEIARLVQRLLQRENYIVDIAPTLSYAREALRSTDYPLVLLDRMLPDGEGTDLVAFARRHDIKSRFLILSALGDISRRVEGLDLGADDYIVKPFEPEELLARLRAALRRPVPDQNRVWRCGKVAFELPSRQVRINGGPVSFPRRELVILETLIKAAGRVVTRDHLEDSVYGYEDEIQSNTMESHISRLRKQLTQQGAGVMIHAVRGVGYMMKEEA